MTREEELKIRLEQHKMWLLDSSKGERFVAKAGENLSYANLRYANLSYADLSSADLRSANLSYADLSYANLSYANLRYANLRYANLSYVFGFRFIPLQVVNTKFFITILDDHVLWGCKKMTFDEVKSFEIKDCTSEWNADEFKLNKKIITELIRYYRK